MSKLKSITNYFEHWFELDPRAMGIFRIAFGLHSMADVIRRFDTIEMFYSNEGLFSNHFSLFRPLAKYLFSFMFSLSHADEAKAFFVLTLIFLFFFIIGYKTRFFHVLCMLCIISIHNRVLMVQNGGDVVLNLWWLWTAFLPLGKRFSVDAMLSSFKQYKDITESSLKLSLPVETKPYRSLAAFAFLMQLCVIYFFNTVHKGGETWHEGTSIHYLLHQDRMVTTFGLWVREHAGLWLSKILTWSTLAIEGAAPFLLLIPFPKRKQKVWARRIALFTLTGLHVGIFLMADVGFFSPTMIVSYMLLLQKEDIEALGKALKKIAGNPVIAFYDSDCGVCHLTSRIFKRLDRFELIQWEGRSYNGKLPSKFPREIFDQEREQTIVVWDKNTDQTWIKQFGFSKITTKIPFGFLLAWIFYIPGIRQISGNLYDKFSKNRHRVSAWLGMGICGINKATESKVPSLSEITATEYDSAAKAFSRKAGNIALTTVLLVFMAATTSQMLVENRIIKNNLQIPQPDWAKRIVQYGRFYQGWSMFSPNVSRHDNWLVIDVELEDGRHIDPQTGLEPQFVPANANIMRWGQFWDLYSERIAYDNKRAYRKEFGLWLRSSQKRFHLNPKDKVIAYKVFSIVDKSPEPGSNKGPEITKKNLLMEWKK